mgnify:CR=1 FL=1
MKDMNIYNHRPKPAYRTYIEKKNGKLRPLGIPTIKDRVYQNIARLALEPQWEAKFEPTSYGFRPKGIVMMRLKGFSTPLETKSNGFSKVILKDALTI